MLELGSVKEIIKVLEWIATFGHSDIERIKSDINDLISELSKSLANLWDVVTQVTSIKEDAFSEKSFEQIYDYFFKFYVGDWNISPARTHCGNVERTVKRIKFKVAEFFHTNIGKWDEVDGKLKLIVDRDGKILREYDASINTLDSSLKEVRALLQNGDIVSAKRKYYSLKSDLESDIQVLSEGVKRMEQASSHVNKLAG